MKPAIKVAVAAVALFGLLVGVAAAQGRFSDVPSGHENAAAIEWAASVGVTLGYNDGTFKPAEPLKRRHARVFLERYYDEVLGAEGDDEFQPPEFTRGDMMQLLYDMKHNTTTTTTTAPPTTTTLSTTCSDAICLVDHYWFGSGYNDSTDNYAVKFRVNQSCATLYVEVQLLDSNSRRIGDWGNELLRSPAVGREFTVEVNFINDWDSFARFEWEYNCR